MGTDSADELDRLEQAYRGAVARDREPDDLDARIAKLPDEAAPRFRRRVRPTPAEVDEALAPAGPTELTPALREAIEGIAAAVVRIEERLETLEDTVATSAALRASYATLSRQLEDLTGALQDVADVDEPDLPDDSDQSAVRRVLDRFSRRDR